MLAAPAIQRCTLRSPIQWYREKQELERRAKIDAATEFFVRLDQHLEGKGIQVTPESVLRGATALACIKVIAGDIAGLPIDVFHGADEATAEKVTDHPMCYPLQRVAHHGRRLSPRDVVEPVVAWALLHGKGYILPGKRDGRVTLRPIPPGLIEQLEFEEGNDEEIFHRYHPGGRVPSRSLLEGELVYVRGPLFNSASDEPVPVHQTTPDPYQIANAISEFTNSWFENGAHLDLQMTIPSGMDVKKARLLIASLQGFLGSKNAGRIFPIIDGAKLEQVGGNPKDSQLIEAAEAAGLDVCRTYGVPPHMVGYLKDANYSNMEAQNRDWARRGLYYYLLMVEAALNRDLFWSGPYADPLYWCRFNMDAFLRGSLVERSEALANLSQVEVFTEDELRAYMGKAPRKGGDVHVRSRTQIQS